MYSLDIVVHEFIFFDASKDFSLHNITLFFIWDLHNFEHFFSKSLSLWMKINIVCKTLHVPFA